MMGYKYFTDAELMCRCCHRQEMSSEFMGKIVVLRAMYGRPLTVTSAFRCTAHNCVVSPKTGTTGPHTTGRAIDFQVSGGNAHRLLQLALESHAFTGIGIKQNGPHAGRFIHLDDLSGDTRPWIWTY